MMDRRRFLETGACAALATALPRLRATTPRKLDRIGVQLYTVRSQMGPDRGPRSVEETLQGVAQIGYREVQFAGYFGRTPSQIRSALDAAGFGAPGGACPRSALAVD